VALPLASGDAYYMLNDFNHHHHHAVLAGLDEGLLSFCLPHSRLYGESI
jgi:hypothetical protein